LFVGFSGDLTRLSVGGMIAIPSGAGVALSVLGGNAGQISKISKSNDYLLFFRFISWCSYISIITSTGC